MSQQEAIRILALEGAVRQLTERLDAVHTRIDFRDERIEEMERRLAALEAKPKKAP
jgi:polyhydroxyalkanoate synthesis regulator phasin